MHYNDKLVESQTNKIEAGSTSPPLRIMLVEDNEQDRAAFRQAFQNSAISCNISEFKCAEEAMEQLSSDASRFDIVVTGYKLPGITGLELCEKLIKKKIVVPKVLMTSTGSENIVVQAIKAGVNDYIVKDSDHGYLKLLPAVLPETVRKHGDSVKRKLAEKELENLRNHLEKQIEKRTQALRESESKYRELVDNANSIILRLDKHGMINFFNEFAQSFFGFTEEEILGRHVVGTIVPEIETTGRALRPLIDDIVMHPLNYQYHVNENMRRSGERAWIAWTNKLLLDEEGNPAGTLSIGTDITDRRRAEEQVLASLREKEILLREIHHRVKNNMQIITSLLNLQVSRMTDSYAIDAILECQNRISAMSLVHEALYQSSDLSSISMHKYFMRLFDQIMSSHGINEGHFECHVEADNVLLSIIDAIPVALISNEILTNAFKHAFPEGRRGNVRIAMHNIESGEMELIISDDGVGLSDDINIQTPKTLGIDIIFSLAKSQLRGTIEVNREAGTVYCIRFKPSKKKCFITSSGINNDDFVKSHQV